MDKTSPEIKKCGIIVREKALSIVKLLKREDSCAKGGEAIG